jgi:hypothetical protein
MAAMSESFVDLSYRGLALARRIKLTQVRPSSGYLEMPAPMPVGTTLGIATDDGVLLEAVVTEVHEQVGGADRIPGMLVRPNLTIGHQETWWRSQIALPDAKAESKDPPPADADGKVTLISPRMSGQGAVPELMDDGRDTGVMDAVDMEMAAAPEAGASGSRASTEVDTEIADLPPDSGPRAPRDTLAIPMGQPMAEEGPRTTAMDAVDLAALGLESSSDSLPTAKPEDYADAPPEKTDGGKAKKKRKKR